MAKRAQSSKQGNSRILAIIAVVAVIIVVILVVINNTSNSANVNNSELSTLQRGVTEDGLPYLGDPEAPVTMLVYEDMGCPNCKTFFDEVEPQVIEDFVSEGIVKLVIITVAFVNRASLPGAEGVICALEQEKFFEFRDLLFQSQGVRPYDRENFRNYASDLDMNVDTFMECFDFATHEQSIIQQSQAAFDFGITGTPTSIIGGERYVGVIPYETNLETGQTGIKEILEQAVVDAGG